MKLTNISDEGAVLLANYGIIGQAGEDYVNAKIELYRSVDGGKLSQEALTTAKECLEFFRGTDFERLNSKVDPNNLIKMLNLRALKLYRNEVKTGERAEFHRVTELLQV